MSTDANRITKAYQTINHRVFFEDLVEAADGCEEENCAGCESVTEHLGYK